MVLKLVSVSTTRLCFFATTIWDPTTRKILEAALRARRQTDTEMTLLKSLSRKFKVTHVSTDVLNKLIIRRRDTTTQSRYNR